MPLTFLNIVSIIIIFQLTLLTLFLFTSSKGKIISNRLLGVFFVLLLINLSDGLLSYYGFYTRFPLLAHLEDGFVFLLGPVLYFYTKSVIYRHHAFHFRQLVHAIPFAVITIAYLLFYHLQPKEYQLMIQNAIVDQTLPPMFYVVTLMIYTHVGAYVFMALRELHRYRRQIRDRFSSVDNRNMDWLSFLIWSVAAILAISLFYTFLPAVGLRDYFNVFFGIAFVFLFFFINAIVWKGLRQPEIFSGIEEPPSERKYAANLTDSDKTQIRAALDDAMLVRKKYLDPDLTLDALAAEIGHSPKKVSQIINDTFGQNFFDYINTHRIREAERLFRESTDTRLTILEVMYACGFNSKSSFNTIFKQKTGTTPSAYKQGLSRERAAQ